MVNYTMLDVISQGEGEQHIKMTVQDLKTRLIWDLIVVYGEAQPDRKAAFLAEYLEFAKIMLTLFK